MDADSLLIELYDAEALALAAWAEAEQDILDGMLAMVSARLFGDQLRETRGRAQMWRGTAVLARLRCGANSAGPAEQPWPEPGARPTWLLAAAR